MQWSSKWSTISQRSNLTNGSIHWILIISSGTLKKKKWLFKFLFLVHTRCVCTSVGVCDTPWCVRACISVFFCVWGTRTHRHPPSPHTDTWMRLVSGLASLPSSADEAHAVLSPHPLISWRHFSHYQILFDVFVSWWLTMVTKHWSGLFKI